MVKNYRFLSQLWVIMIAAVFGLQGTVADVTGDTGTAQSGSLVLSGGTSGAVFDSTSSSITESFNFLSLPLTSATDGQILMGGITVFHCMGSQNVFVGGYAGNTTTTSNASTGCGNFALNSITVGQDNTAVGQSALVNLTIGSDNTAVGMQSGIGLIDGIGNTLIGTAAGSAYVGNESNNLILGCNAAVAGESDVIRIGFGQEKCYIDGIYGVAVDFSSGLPMVIDANGNLGTIISSARFKHNIQDIDNESSSILNLRPVSFVLQSDKSQSKQYGLIAEEVEEIFPDLVVKDKNCCPYAVRYFELPVLLLNELKKSNAQITKLEQMIQAMADRLARLEAALGH